MRIHDSPAAVGLAAVQSPGVRALIAAYDQRLREAGYHPRVARLHRHAIAHFSVWLECEHRPLPTIDDQTVDAFAQHRATCACPGTSRRHGREVVSCVRRFLAHLREEGVVPRGSAGPPPPALVAGFLEWMEVHRGVSVQTRTAYGSYVAHLVRVLGDAPAAYTAQGLRDFVAQEYRHYRRNSMRMVVAAVRMFLRYLADAGQCRPGLEHALPPLANWARSSLPRGLSTDDLDRVLAACPATPRGLRDRAVLLLLIRLGLRAGDVAQLRFADLCFDTATLRVAGKGRREARLPLPQDVGDAVLAYLRAGRPRVPSEFVFLRAVGPRTPFARPRPGGGVAHIARAALQRAGVQPPTRGAHVFRHSAACQLLRQGVPLEGIATVLRHRSIETTGLYAKVDQTLLAAVVQPWPVAVGPC